MGERRWGWSPRTGIRGAVLSPLPHTWGRGRTARFASRSGEGDFDPPHSSPQGPAMTSLLRAALAALLLAAPLAFAPAADTPKAKGVSASLQPFVENGHLAGAV